jgi:peroxiredoxin
MKYLPFIGGALLAFGFLSGPGDSAYTLHGHIKGLDTGWVYLYHPGDEPTDSAIISRGRFYLSGTVSEPEFCHLIFRKLDHDLIYSSGFFIQAGDLGVTGDKDSVSSLVPSGAPLQEEYLHFARMMDTSADWEAWGHAKDAAVAAKNKSRQDSLMAAAEIMTARQKQLAKNYAATHPSSYVALAEIEEYFGYNPDAVELQGIYNGFSPEIRASQAGHRLKQLLDVVMLTGIGRPAPGFTQNDSKGKPVTLSSFQGRYLLLDFWASWCGPCREENPNVLKEWRKYHSRGFTVLGVSLDDKKSEWLEAIRKDGLPWTEVSDLKGWKNEAAKLYGVEGIPMNYLIDKEGTIVAKGLRGPDLEIKLEELVH